MNCKHSILKNISILILFFLSNSLLAASKITGTGRIWHPVELTIDGPTVSESETTFRNYRLNVTFNKGSKSFVVPGFFAADGNAAETSATSGNKWRAIFTPDEAGTWNYSVSFRTGKDIAISFDTNAGAPIQKVNGTKGQFIVKPSAPNEKGFFAKGKLNYVGEHFGQFAGNNEWHVKAGPGSPEDIFGYKDFDNTSDWQIRKTKTQIADSFLVKLNGDGLHSFSPHVKDWKTGDPTWKGGKGKGLIGSLNYLASIGANALYIIPFTIGDDSDNTWPWVHRDSIMTYDISKLAQWDIIFSHMDKVGISPNYYLCESDNSIKYLDKGDMILKFPIYYREIIARFGYHLGMRFNLGEELKQTGPQQAAAAKYLKDLDPYNTIIAGHSSHIRDHQIKIFEHLLGNINYDGPNYQLHEKEKTDHLDLILWRDRSAAAGHKWIVANDESWGVDNSANGEKRMLSYVWRTHMAGAEGMFQYTAYSKPEIGDITMENFRLIENTQKIQIACKDLFLKTEINPYLIKMKNENALVGNPAGNDAPFCFAQKGERYIVYRTTAANQPQLDLSDAKGVFIVKWYNAFKGGVFQNGSVTSVTGGGLVSLGNAPSNINGPWAVIITKEKSPCGDEKNILANSAGYEGCTVLGSRNYCVNTTATLIARAGVGAEFVNWTENGAVVSAENPYLFNVTADRTLIANFAKSKQSFVKISTIESSPNDGKTSGGGDYQINEMITVMATPTTCYQFNNWTENGMVVSENPNYSFKVTGPRNLKANFIAKSYTVITVPEAGGVVNGELLYVCGAVISIKATPNEGYKFDGWYANDKLISSQATDDINIETEYQLEGRFSLLK